MLTVDTVQSFVSSYAAEALSVDQTGAEADIVFSKLLHKYEVLQSDRPALNILVDRWFGGERHTFDPEFTAFDRRFEAAKSKTYERRCELQHDAEQFVLDTRGACLAQKRCYAQEMPDVAGPDLDANFLGLLDACPGLVLGEVHSHVGARKLLIENMPALKERGVERLYMQQLLTDVHGDDLRALNESPHNPISPRLAQYLQAQDNGHRQASRVDREVWDKYSYTAVVDAAHRAGISVIALDCAASYFLKGGERGRDDSEAWRIPVANYFSYLALSEASSARDLVSAPKQDGKWIALVGNTSMSVFDGVPGLSELMGVPGLRFEDAQENRVDPDAGREVEHPGCFSWDNKNILMKGDFLFKVDVLQPATPQRRPLLTRVFDRLPFHLTRRET